MKHYKRFPTDISSSHIIHNFNSSIIESSPQESVREVEDVNFRCNPESPNTPALESQGTKVQEIPSDYEVENASSMLTREQKLLFSRLIFNAKEILFADSANSEVTKPEKASKWFEILMQLNSVGANIPDYKTIRDQEWSNMRRAVEKKVCARFYKYIFIILL